MSHLTDTLTTRQMAVFEFIRDKILARGYGPTVREIGEHFQISSPNGVMCHLRALEKKGLLHRVRKADRAIARAIARSCLRTRCKRPFFSSALKWHMTPLGELI